LINQQCGGNVGEAQMKWRLHNLETNVIIVRSGSAIIMKIFSVDFIKGCLKSEDYPKGDSPEIAFVGRSNVGKSSVINTLLRHKGMAKVSSTPGKTRQIYFFIINRSFYFVDLPGYGYAKVPKEMRASWAPFIEHYLMNRRQLRGVVFLLDARHAPTELDFQMKTWLERAGVPALNVLTKMDKLPRGAQQKAIEEHQASLGLKPNQTVIPFSAKTGQGKDLLWRSIERLLAQHVMR
jgi:GTP-binding protein